LKGIQCRLTARSAGPLSLKSSAPPAGMRQKRYAEGSVIKQCPTLAGTDKPSAAQRRRARSEALVHGAGALDLDAVAVNASRTVLR
jgi:hypothetical protein